MHKAHMKGGDDTPHREGHGEGTGSNRLQFPGEKHFQANNTNQHGESEGNRTPGTVPAWVTTKGGQQFVNKIGESKQPPGITQQICI